MSLTIAPGDLDDPEIRALIGAHHALAAASTAPENIFVLDVAALRAPDLSFFAGRDSTGHVMAIGALRALPGAAGEIKSLHVAGAARGRGYGREMLDHLIALARSRGMVRLWLETGSMAAYAPSRALYARSGFEVCGPFGDYPAHPNSTFMTKPLDGGTGDRANADRQIQDKSGRV